MRRIVFALAVVALEAVTAQGGTLAGGARFVGQQPDGTITSLTLGPGSTWQMQGATSSVTSGSYVMRDEKTLCLTQRELQADSRCLLATLNGQGEPVALIDGNGVRLVRAENVNPDR